MTRPKPVLWERIKQELAQEKGLSDADWNAYIESEAAQAELIKRYLDAEQHQAKADWQAFIHSPEAHTNKQDFKKVIKRINERRLP